MTFENKTNNVEVLIEDISSFLIKFIIFIFINENLFLTHNRFKEQIKLNNNSEYINYSLYAYVKIKLKYILNKVIIDQYTHNMV